MSEDQVQASGAVPGRPSAQDMGAMLSGHSLELLSLIGQASGRVWLGSLSLITEGHLWPLTSEGYRETFPEGLAPLLDMMAGQLWPLIDFAAIPVPDRHYYDGAVREVRLTPYGQAVYDAQQPQRTAADLAALKASWVSCDEPEEWDLTCEPGFEAHKDELAAFMATNLVEWEKARAARKAARLADLAEKSGLTPELAGRLETETAVFEAERDRLRHIIGHLFTNAGLTYPDAGVDFDQITDAIIVLARSSARMEGLTLLGEQSKAAQ